MFREKLLWNASSLAPPTIPAPVVPRGAGGVPLALACALRGCQDTAAASRRSGVILGRFADYGRDIRRKYRAVQSEGLAIPCKTEPRTAVEAVRGQDTYKNSPPPDGNPHDTPTAEEIGHVPQTYVAPARHVQSRALSKLASARPRMFQYAMIPRSGNSRPSGRSARDASRSSPAYAVGRAG